VIEIRALEDPEEFQKTRAIQQDAWGFTDAEAESHLLMNRVQKYGGVVQGMFLEGEMIGFSYAILARWNGEAFIFSHMVAVARGHQNRGYGVLLKQAQRARVLELGHRVIRWNFDPLEALNAYFNLHRLGAVSVEYERNVYGVGASGLHEGLPTDRLIATWHLDADRVVERVNRKLPPVIEDVPGKAVGDFSKDVAYVELPKDIRSIKESDMKEALKWRLAQREAFETAFRTGFTVEEVVFTPDRRRAYFRLSRRSPK